MAVKNLSTRVAIIGRGAKCRGGSSAVDKSAYISRTTMYSEYDGTTYYPKYTEDLVHNEVMLPVNAPAEYSDPSVLWNSVEMRESKSAKAQLARSYKINLPNEWSYELAIEVMRDYVKRNFVDDGMCAQFAIHDSENPNTHQRNLHCHIMLTMRPILEDGSWGDKQKKIYALDADGNKIRKKNGQYKCTTQDVTGWNSRENARKWRKDLADTINAVNDKNGLRENFWEHRSFAEQGLDTIPQIHLGEKASALERAGIQTERGNVNRRIMEQNKAIVVRLIRANLGTNEFSLNEVFYNHFQRLTILFIHCQKEQRQHDDHHGQCCKAHISGCFDQKENRHSDERRRTKAK